MKITDLRVGNMVKCKVSNDAGIYEIQGIEKYTEQVKLWGGCRGGEIHHLSKIKPIPLTREILARVSFLAITEDGNDPYYEGRVDDRIFCMEGDKNGYLEAVFMDMDFNEIKRVRYLHDLQNAYWFFTGEEMDIKNDGI